MVDKTSSTPLYTQIEAWLWEQIRAGNYAPGSQVPSETELSTTCNVSRMTARKALDNLVARGVLYRRKGKGTYVTENVMTYGLSTLLSFSHTFRELGFDVTTRVLKKVVINAPESVADALALPPNSQVIMIKRLRLVGERAAAIHTSYLEHPLFSLLLNLDLSRASLLEAMGRVKGVHLTHTEDTVQAASATAEDAIYLDVPLSSPVLNVEGIAYTDKEQPVRFTRATYRGDMFKLKVVNTASALPTAQFSGVTLGDGWVAETNGD